MTEWAQNEEETTTKLNCRFIISDVVFKKNFFLLSIWALYRQLGDYIIKLCCGEVRKEMSDIKKWKMTSDC